MPQDVALSGMDGVQWAQLELMGLCSGCLTHRESNAQFYSCFSMEQSSRKSVGREQQRGSSGADDPPANDPSPAGWNQ